MVGGNKSHTPFDSRLLLSLVKCEKEVADSFKSYTQTCENANNALNGWAAADTGDSREFYIERSPLNSLQLSSANRRGKGSHGRAFTLTDIDDLDINSRRPHR